MADETDMKSRPAVRIMEVGPRDGLQNIANAVPTTVKIELIERLRAAGLRRIEVTSAVSPKAVPQLADSQDLLSSHSLQAMIPQPGMRMPVLVPNVRGLRLAMQHGVKEVAIFVSATEGFSRANTNCSVEEGLRRAGEVVEMAMKAGVQVRGYISCIFEDPFDGVTPESAVLHALKRLLDMGCYEVSLGDTLGTGTTADVRRVLTYLYDHGILAEKLAGHFHDTYGQAVLNVWTAYELGIRVFDSSVGGLGGCPYAPGAKGNVATEDLVYLFQRAGIETGVDLQKLSETGQWISQQLRKPNDSRAGAALARKAQPASKPPTCQDLEWTTLPTETDGIQILRSGLNVKIILNRPNNGNALTSSMIAEVTLFFEAAASNTAISRIVLTGDGNFFCTGMDLGKDCAVAKSAEVSNDQFKRLSRLFEAIFNSPQVTIAAINGPAFGTGVGLAFACDIHIGTTNATFTLSEVKPGLSPTTISKHVARKWGLAFTHEAMLSNRAVPFAQLLSLGIVAEMVASKAELDGALNRYLGMLHNAGTRASTPVKELVRVGMAGNAEGVQASRIIQVFEEMMKPGSEAEFGAREFLAARRDVDWDAVQVVQGRAKL